MNTIKDPSIRVYVVWTAMLPSDREEPDQKTLSLISDPRVTHYWDPDRILPALFRDTLRLPPGYLAWDVYLIYPPGMKWKKKPPRPVYWQHQLGGRLKAPRLDGKAFARELRKIVLTSQHSTH